MGTKDCEGSHLELIEHLRITNKESKKNELDLIANMVQLCGKMDEMEIRNLELEKEVVLLKGRNERLEKKIQDTRFQSPTVEKCDQNLESTTALLAAKTEEFELLKKKCDDLTKQTLQLHTMQTDLEDAKQRLECATSELGKNSKVIETLIQERNSAVADAQKAIFEERKRKQSSRDKEVEQLNLRIAQLEGVVEETTKRCDSLATDKAKLLSKNEELSEQLCDNMRKYEESATVSLKKHSLEMEGQEHENQCLHTRLYTAEKLLGSYRSKYDKLVNRFKKLNQDYMIALKQFDSDTEDC